MDNPKFEAGDLLESKYAMTKAVYLIIKIDKPDYRLLDIQDGKIRTGGIHFMDINYKIAEQVS